MTPEQRIAALKAHYLAVLVEDPQDGTSLDNMILDTIDGLFEKINKPKTIITLEDLKVTQHAIKHPDSKPGFEAIGKSVTHIELLEIDGVMSPCFTEFCKCRSPQWAGRVADSLNKLYPDGKMPEESAT